MSNSFEYLLSTSEAQERLQTIQHQYGLPHTYEVTSGQQCIAAVGVEHIFNTDNPQLDTINQKWSEFLQNSSKPRLALCEGGVRDLASSPEQAVLHDSEAGLIRYLAHEANIEVVSPEPDEAAEITELLESFSKEEIMYYYFSRHIVQWAFRNHHQQIDFEDYIQRNMLQRYERLLEWEDFDFSLEHMKHIHRRITGYIFELPGVSQSEEGNKLHWHAGIAPKEVEATSARIRDKHVLSELTRLWRSGYNLFMVYGAFHTVTLEPSIRRLAAKDPHLKLDAENTTGKYRGEL